MNSRSRLILLSCALMLSACSPTLSKDDLAKAIKKIMPINFEIVESHPLKELPGLIEVVVRADQQVVVIYMDNKGKYVVSGSIIDVDTKKNLTLEAQKKYNKK